ncbi:hypothetical protein LCGC14_1187900 [marine sediment metagenome]|uniref:Uncharacterized protein n=1 Tax=marine sediment metagenome TaxID=412755 RepID=A0A0F9P2Z8_9ZZZZ
MKLFEDIFYGYTVKEKDENGRYVHHDKGWTVSNGIRLFTKAGALAFVNAHEKELIILRS